MSAALRNLVGLRSLLAEEVLGYLDAVAADAAALPAYYPPHLREGVAGETPFDRIRQVVQVIDEDQREALQRWRAEERERQRAAGIEDRMAYDPVRARPELAEHEEERERAERREAVRREPPPPIEWDAHTGARFPRAVLLGDPGGGKTWLLRYEARRIARESATRLRAGEATVETLPLPFLFRLSDLAASGAEIEQAIPQRVLAVLKPTLARLERAVPSAGFLRLVAHSLVRGTAVVLLDAWDEVPAGSLSRPDADNPREALGSHLARFVQAHPRLRLLVSSRIVGYPGKPAPDWHELELLAFDAPQIERFIHVWFGPRAPAFANLQDLLRRQVQLAGLARIPLMLALICRVFDEGGEKDLPTRRVELYERCLLGLLLHWGKERSGRAVVSRRQPGEEGYAEALLEVLQASAFELFETQHEQFTEALLTRSLNRSLGQLELHHPLRGRSAPELIAELAIRGVLTESGSGHYLFLHRTVQEYLVARHVAACVEEVGGSGDQRWDRARVRLPDGTEVSVYAWADERAIRPAYSQPMQLLAGRLAEPLPLLQLLADEERDDILRHRLALAGTCIGEIDPTMRARYTSMNVDPLSVIASAGFDFWAECKEKNVGILAQHFLPALRVYSATGVCLFTTGYGRRWCADGQALTDMLTRMLLDEDAAMDACKLVKLLGATVATASVLNALARLLVHDNPYLREEAAEAAGQLGSALASVSFLSPLLRLLRAGGDDFAAAVDGLKEFGPLVAVPLVIKTTMPYLRNEDEHVRFLATRSVGRFGVKAATEPILAALVQLLTDEDLYVRAAAADAVGRLGAAAGTEPIPSILTRLVAEDTLLVKQAASRALVGVCDAATTAPILGALVRLLAHEDAWVREEAVVTLGWLGTASPTEVIVSELERMLADENYRVMVAAARAVGRLSTKPLTKQILDHLATLIADRERSVQMVAAEAVAELGGVAATEPIITNLMNLLLEDPDREMSIAVGRALGVFGAAASKPVLSALPLLLSDGHSGQRCAAADLAAALGEVAATESILTALVQVVADEDRITRRAAIRTLGILREVAATWSVLNALSFMLANEDSIRKCAAAEAIGALGKTAAREPIVSALLQLLTDEDWKVRGAVVTALCKLGAATSEPVKTTLVEMLASESALLACNAAQAVGALGGAAATPPIASALIRLIFSSPYGGEGKDAACQALAHFDVQGVRIFRDHQGQFETRMVRGHAG